MAELALFERRSHRRRSARLHAEYFHIGAQGLDGECHARNQAAAADRHDYRLHIRHLLKDLKADSSLAGYNLGVVEGVHESIAVLFLQLHSLGVGVVIYARHQTNLGAVALGSLYFRYRGTGREAYQRLDTVVRRTESHALRMIACRAGYYTAALLLVGELRYLIVSAAELKRPRQLQVFCLQINIEPRA